jgi:hypothetical protein
MLDSLDGRIHVTAHPHYVRRLSDRLVRVTKRVGWPIALID